MVDLSWHILQCGLTMSSTYTPRSVVYGSHHLFMGSIKLFPLLSGSEIRGIIGRYDGTALPFPEIRCLCCQDTWWPKHTTSVQANLVPSPDLIRPVYRFQYDVCAILKVISAGIGFGSGTETKVNPTLVPSLLSTLHVALTLKLPCTLYHKSWGRNWKWGSLNWGHQDTFWPQSSAVKSSGLFPRTFSVV